MSTNETGDNPRRPPQDDDDNENINKFIRRLNNFWAKWANDLEAWRPVHPHASPDGQQALMKQLYEIADAMMHRAQELDGR
jgi:hypothetical protein